jgi:crotonobetainyl-CoA:carnitine CoA-transferase CaiB-like acyl-CoA transferase
MTRRRPCFGVPPAARYLAHVSQPLEGIRVVELAEGIAGPYAGKLLADYGADVVKVEPPAGDRSRHLGPFPAGTRDPETGALYLHLNTNKRSVDGTPDDELITRLIADADIVIQSSPDPDPARLRRDHPGLTVVTVTAFGLTGPLAGWKGEEIVHYAYGGPMSASGNPDREPLKMGGDVGQYQCGTIAAVAALAGVAVAGHSGEGVHVDLSNVETQVGSIDRRMTYLLFGAYRGENVPREGGYNLAPFPIGCRPALDGHVQVSTLINWIPRMLSVVDDPEMSALFENPNWLFDEQHPDSVEAQLLQWTLGRGRQEAMEEAQAKGWPVTAVNRPVDLLTDPHFTAREFFVDVEHPVAGAVRQPGPPIRMDDGWSVRRPAPLLGQHTDEVASEPPRPAVDVSRGDGPVRLPLEGVRVLDMTVVWAGPYATQLLGDLGADVVRVDNPWVFPSATRGVMPRPTAEMVAELGGIFGGYPNAEPGERPWNRIALFNAHARNKRSVTLDLRKDLGREAFLRLVEECDVMVENNSVDLLDKLGIGWDDLRARNPGLILVRMPSAGLTGPYRSYLGFGVNFEALCGLGALRGYRDSDLSENEAVYHMDAASGSAGAFAVLAALRRRERTGVGELIELSQCENMLNHIGELLIDAGRDGVAHERLGNRHRVYAPQGCYRCDGDDQWVVLSVTSDAEWNALKGVLGDPDWATVELDDVEGRRAAHDLLDSELARWAGGRTAMDAAETLQAAGVPAAPVLHELESLRDPHLRARGMFAPNGSVDTGVYDHPTHVWRWDGPDLRFGPLPVLGEHNEEVFRELLGMSEDEYRQLDADGHLQTDYLTPDGTSF